MTDPKDFLVAIDNANGDQTPVLIFADWQQENNFPDSAEILRSGLGWFGGGYGGGGDGYGGGDGDGGGDGYGGGRGGYGDGGGGYDDDGDDGGGGGYGDGGGGYDDDGDGGYGDDGGKHFISRGFAMVEPGLHIICSPGGYYPYVRIGWCERRDGIIVMKNCRLIKRFGTNAELSRIAEEGPKSNTNLLAMAKYETVSVGMVSRCIPCNPKAWKQQCPEPK